ncbi:MAG: 50S ribosomal protein L5 [Candidatus Rokubacteria bacterium]|nr:50S ribosomal protein L5 [Candidatus Rokubacteria bacterium]
MAKPDKPQAGAAKGASPKGGAAPVKGGKGQGAPKGEPQEKAPPARPRSTGTIPPRLRELYRRVVVPALVKERGYRNPHQAPRVDKIVINMGLGEARENVKVLDYATADLQAITGQRPVVTKAKKSIANFKIRAAMPIGLKVTLRGARMYEFLDRLVNVALPRVRDFRGVSPKSFDGRGNYALGLTEQVIFPEVVYDKIDKTRGMDVIICTTARSDEEAKALLAHLGMPFRE